MNYAWSTTFPESTSEQTSHLSQFQKGEKRELECEAFHTRTNTLVVKRQRKPRIRAGSLNESPTSSPQSSPSEPKDKGRGRYACLNHRMKHKRCPPDCKERRPKPTKANSEPASPIDPTNAQKNVLKLEESQKQVQTPPASSPVGVVNNPGTPLPQGEPLLAHLASPPKITLLNPLETMSALPTLDGPFNWDAVSWDSFMDDDQSHSSWGVDAETWEDLNSSSHWESSKEFIAPDVPTETDMEVGSPFASGSSSEARSVSPIRRHLLRMLLTRDTLERWISDPFFNKVVQGFYVRVRIGEYMHTSVYRLAKIDEIQERAFYSYPLGKEMTTKGVILQVGASSKKTFSLMSISNKPPTEVDLQHWEEEMLRTKSSVTEQEVREREEVMRDMTIKYPPTAVVTSTSS